MRTVIAGGGPAGLLFALLAKRRFPQWTVEVIEQNPADVTFGFGVVFSQGALGFLERDAPDLYRSLMPRMELWPIQRIVDRDERVDIDGNGYSAIARLALIQFLQALCEQAGVRIDYGRKISAAADLAPADLIVAADGVNSALRREREQEFEPSIDWLTNKFAWYGTPRAYDCLTLTFRTNEHGVQGTLLSGIDLAQGPAAKAWIITVLPDYKGFLLAILPPGAFIGLGLLIAGRNWLDQRAQRRARLLARAAAAQPA